MVWGAGEGGKEENCVYAQVFRTCLCRLEIMALLSAHSKSARVRCVLGIIIFKTPHYANGKLRLIKEKMFATQVFHLLVRDTIISQTLFRVIHGSA